MQMVVNHFIPDQNIKGFTLYRLLLGLLSNKHMHNPQKNNTPNTARTKTKQN